MPYFDRYDICDAYWQIEADYNVGGWLRERASNRRRRESIGVQLHRMGYRMGRGPLSENAQAIYDNAVRRFGLPTDEDN